MENVSTELKIKLNKIKYSRLSPVEKFLYPIFFELRPNETYEYSNVTFFFNKKDDQLYFEYNKRKKYFWFIYFKIWRNLVNQYHLDEMEIESLIKDIAQKTLNIKIIKVLKY